MFCAPGVLRTAQEEQPDVIPAHVPPHDDAGVRVDRHQVPARRSRHPARRHQLPGARGHVLLLHGGGHGPAVPEVPGLEVVRDGDPAGAVRHRLLPLGAGAVPTVQLPEGHRLPARAQRHPLHANVRQLLLPLVRAGAQAAEARRPGRGRRRRRQGGQAAAGRGRAAEQQRSRHHGPQRAQHHGPQRRQRQSQGQLSCVCVHSRTRNRASLLLPR